MLKVIPYVIAAGYVAYTGFAFYDIDIIWVSYFIHLSFLPWLFVYLASWVFRFCYVHRMPLYYILVNDNITIVDTYLGIPISTFKLLMVHSIILGICIFIIMWWYVKHHKKDLGRVY